MSSTFKNTETNFVDGVEFEEVGMDGRLAKNLIKSDGPNKLVMDVSVENMKSRVVREVVGDKMIQVCL
jgi:hypothetical protein